MLKKLLKYSFFSIAVIVLVAIVCNVIIVANAAGKSFDSVKEIPHNKYALLLGTSPVTRHGAHNFYFDYRINSAVDLFKAGKVDYIIASGGDYSGKQRFGFNELTAMRDSLITKGVDPKKILLDPEGTRTVYSIKKFKDIYGPDSVTLISQGYHNGRTLFLASQYGLNAVAFNAEEPNIPYSRIKNHLREYLARPKMFIDMILPDPGIKQLKEDPYIEAQDYSKEPVKITDNGNLTIYFPNYSKIDLACGQRPQKSDADVIMMCGAAFTGELLDEFRHSNIAGDHVSLGKREKGYTCKRNNGAFVFYNDTPKFLHQNYSGELDAAANAGGCGFGQEMMIHKGKEVAHTRPNKNVNEFRALCLINGKVAVADSKGKVQFGDFIRDLLKAGATEALYLDMGLGWNYSWYRDKDGNPVEIHSTPNKYSTNWITFYK